MSSRLVCLHRQTLAQKQKQSGNEQTIQNQVLVKMNKIWNKEDVQEQNRK
jgi:hypothetical protein